MYIKNCNNCINCITIEITLKLHIKILYIRKMITILSSQINFATINNKKKYETTKHYNFVRDIIR